MDATKYCLSVCFICLCFFANSQGELKSFEFSNKKKSVILKEVVEGFGYYLSYKPDIFKEDPVLSVSFEKQSFDRILHSILDVDFEYHIIDQYVAITYIGKEKQPISISKETERVVYDTVRIEEKIIVYDTQKVVVNHVIYDTILVEKVKYDTITIEEKQKEQPKKILGGLFMSPVIQNDDEVGLYYGFELGVNLRYQLNNLNIQIGSSYGYTQNQITFTKTETHFEERIDTLAQFYIVENDVQVPFYVTDTVLVENEVQRIFDRLNTKQYLQVSIEGGRQFELKNISIGAYLGLNAYWVIGGDNYSVDEQEELATSLLSSSTKIRVSFQLPIFFATKTSRATPYIAPFITSFDLQGNLSRSLRLGSAGIRLGYFF